MTTAQLTTINNLQAKITLLTNQIDRLLSDIKIERVLLVSGDCEIYIDDNILDLDTIRILYLEKLEIELNKSIDLFTNIITVEIP